MVTTFVIGLREGLEAVLIVSIIAAFLRRNGIPRWPMWCGVSLAVLISIGVGLALQAFEQSLPQSKQEGMESIIGLVAVTFVTGMIVWMGKNARGLKAELEGSARAAASKGTGWALAGMAFLAVVKEGFETAVFLLATLHASASASSAALGAAIGILVACVVGYILYAGGTRLNLARFFKISGVFLVFVAGGLLLTAFRTARGAGWIDIGQQHTVDLSWLSPIGSVRSALITGVLGIPADPRVIEALAWLCYVIPVLAIAVWPRRWQPGPARVPTVKFSLAAVAALAAVTLPLAVPTGRPEVPAAIALTTGKADPRGTSAPKAATASLRTHGGSATLVVREGDTTRSVTFAASTRTATRHLGAAAEKWTDRARTADEAHPSTLTIGELAGLFGRVPVGISNTQNPGPYHAVWNTTATTALWVAHHGILDTRRVDQTTLTLTGGGLTQPRTLTLTQPAWSVPGGVASAAGEAVAAGDVTAHERLLWRAWLPVALAAAALGLALTGWRTRGKQARGETPALVPAGTVGISPGAPDSTNTDGAQASAEPPRSTDHVDN
ncbi:iron uptake transporter permease EfeU [Streptomyces sp. 8L]|uniref:iron uptake transporter permease EfeU n=1 Tax=Streptomyces sp. 8L TaxID=2877242 RepID=UPI001CD5C954|nr:iron uptake transporter permease EfeU [Streptomyces sp. 8L]MCA1219866.1 FTR1 family protein [Streptomyces sp. 8L]